MGNKTASSFHQHNFKSGGWLIPTVPTDYVQRWENKLVRTGGTLPKYKQIIANGGSATMPMTIQVFKLEIKSAGNGYVTATDAFSRPCKAYGNLPKDISTAADYYCPPNTVASNQAAAAILKKIRSQQSQMMGGVILKELRETVHLIRHPLSAISSYLTSHVKDIKRHSAKAVKQRNTNEIRRVLADTWLETQFAIGPLLSDVQDGAEALARVHAQPRIKRISSYATHEVQDSVSSSTSGVNSYLQFRRDETVLYRYSTSYHVGLHAHTDFDASPVSRVAELTGFTLSDFVPTVWECLPWSFLIDYWSNIGDVLTAATTDTSKVAWVSRCDTTERIRKSSQVYDESHTRKILLGAGYKNIVVACDGSGSYVSSAKTITRSAGLAYPSLQFSVPSSPFQWANMAALRVSAGKVEKSLRI